MLLVGMLSAGVAAIHALEFINELTVEEYLLEHNKTTRLPLSIGLAEVVLMIKAVILATLTWLVYRASIRIRRIREPCEFQDAIAGLSPIWIVAAGYVVLVMVEKATL